MEIIPSKKRQLQPFPTSPTINQGLTESILKSFAQSYPQLGFLKQAF
jgi:hypothetical protein